MAVHTYERGEAWQAPDPDDPVLDDRTPRPDRIRWAAIWGGLVTAVAVFALLQLTFFATDAVSLDVNPSDDAETTLPFWSGLAAVVAFLLGGLVTGASSRWRRISDGVLQGVVLWGLTTVALLLASGVAAGSLTSQLGGTFGRLAELRDDLANSGSLNDSQLSDARDTAAAAVLLLGLMFVATIVGTVIGTKLWPRRRTPAVHDERRAVRSQWTEDDRRTTADVPPPPPPAPTRSAARTTTVSDLHDVP
jgi:UPF0716 family protein affecting phage T7 exclusion